MIQIQSKRFLLALWLFITGMLLAGCSKDDPVPEPDPVPEEDPVVEDEDPAVESRMFYKLIRKENIGVKDLSADHKPTEKKDPFYFSLETGETVKKRWKQTPRWDISFSGIKNSFIGANNGTSERSYGHRGLGIGGMLILEKHFDEVIDIPADSEFSPGLKVGNDKNGAFGFGVGYYCYDFAGTLFNDGSYDYRHIAYCLAEPATIYKGTPKEKTIPARTIVVKTAKGNYAKIKMISIYKDRFKPEEWRRGQKAPFFTFEYVLAKKGDTKFEIKQ